MTSLKLNLVVVTTIVVAYLHFPTTMASNNWIVGGPRGWIVPPNPDYYESWKKGKEFFNSDEYWFVFKNRSHNVIDVNKEAFDACDPNKDTNATYITETRTRGVVFMTAGIKYLICSHHCSKGHKIMIDVKESKEEW
ncbi:putative Phytocyanin domain, cupredoxin [Helianthus annuus]|uniref:Phytocyanin domain, cupredoxin n=1 Tax=Helianthus annuus TaxID=4232 RepID=A0A251SZ50_HELAN|nr:putative Phytocyanin domain, cupredoxin [Helianthus annuus]KAJ0488060.1 putative Phytocyanin domain, cupredoxin [Helianthus annuus]KAJ0503871.1 putative Phytocyanin domain, cupredoxin [Helianthus annuus]KAJ0673557.1 putative Phytocyanin domain, cupredoxin [Helianthus annuus]KAJ0676914.1 putative Phytocyanin domain, cupredoxin [Helianthus annuus]